MFRNGMLASVAALALSGALWAGELDNERSGAPVTPATPASTIQATGDVLGTVASSEMDNESPTQAWWHRHYGYRGYYRGGFGVSVGFYPSVGYASYYPSYDYGSAYYSPTYYSPAYYSPTFYGSVGYYGGGYRNYSRSYRYGYGGFRGGRRW